MKRQLCFLLIQVIFSPFLSFNSMAQQWKKLMVDNGVSESLARQRREVLDQVHYSISLYIPALRNEAIEGSERIHFNWKKNRDPLQIDFKEDREKLRSISVNGKETGIVFRNEHILIDTALLHPGPNTVAIRFTAGELSLNRNADFLYTLLVPDRARTLFPCFDQPDIKARYQLKLTLPASWKAVANAPLLDSTIQEGSKTYRYTESDLFPTYLFSFVAGRFESAFQVLAGRPFHFYYRETDSNKIRFSLDTIFGLHAVALNYLEQYTGIPFPFRKLDFTAIPDFQYGGMEHVGAIDYKASTLFLDSGATKDQENARSNLIAHETAHMWFGDLVTMQWFNDVWMKEVFANFMADKVTQGSSNYELKFVLSHLPRAYAVDRTAGANPIRQSLNNLQDAGTLYGAIIYDKAPVMMRQLERLMGKEEFREGIREYLKKYSFGNATWPDLISILDKRTPADLPAWNKVWVNEPGRPLLRYSLQKKNNRISRLVISQEREQGRPYLLPQFFEVALVYPGHTEEFTVNMNSREIPVKQAEGKAMPLFILFNSSGQGYGLFPVDPGMNEHFGELQNPLMRASAYINLYENMLSGRGIQPAELLHLYEGLLSREAEELNLGMMTGQMADIYWRLIAPKVRSQMADTLEALLWQALIKETTANKKKILFRTFQNIAIGKSSLDILYAIWKERRPPAGVSLSEEDYTSLALNLSVKDYPLPGILEEQKSRITNPDRKLRLEFLIPAVSSDGLVRDRFFASLKDQKIRKKEAWVADALGYLHHPLRTARSRKYLRESLDMLEEIQLTGDIFFPGAWLGATLGSYQTPEAANIVRQFLKANPGYNPKLKAKILQAADPLFRAERLVKR